MTLAVKADKEGNIVIAASDLARFQAIEAAARAAMGAIAHTPYSDPAVRTHMSEGGEADKAYWMLKAALRLPQPDMG